VSNIDLLKKFYSLFKAGDRQGYLQLCDDAIEWTTLKGMPSGGRYVGKDAVFDGYFPKMLANFAEFHAVPSEYIDASNSAVVLGKYSGRSKAGREFEAPFAHVYTFSNGRIASFRQYTDTAMIRQAL
jgi:ketosteroid isomerase-like protein